MQKFFIPAKGALVRHLKTYNIVPEQGELVDWNGANGRYFRRRVSCGDGSIGPIPTETTQPKKKKKERLNGN